MEKIKLFDGERKLMELLWEHEGATARELSHMAAKAVGWNKNTTYTVIKKLVDKGVIARSEPGFACRSLISKEEAGRDEAKEVLHTFFGGSVGALFSAFLADGTLPVEEAEKLRALIDQYGEEA